MANSKPVVSVALQRFTDCEASIRETREARASAYAEMRNMGADDQVINMCQSLTDSELAHFMVFCSGLIQGGIEFQRNHQATCPTCKGR